MKKQILIIALLFSACFTSFAQEENSYIIDLNDALSVSKNIEALSKAETTFWTKALNLDDDLSAKLQNNNYSIYMQYIQAMKSQNYKMEKVLLGEQYNFLTRRTRFMQTFMPAKKFASYEKIVAEQAKKTLARYDEPLNDEIRNMRPLSAGWNVLGTTITFK